MTDSVMLQLHRDLASDLERIARRFKNPKITLVVRAPQLADGDVVLTDETDHGAAAIAAIRKAMNTPTVVSSSSEPLCNIHDNGLHTSGCKVTR